MASKKPFIGRQEELQTLIKLQQKKTASFVVIKGRRRIGKSRLVEEFSQHFDHYYKFEGLAPEDGINSADQLLAFCHQISRQFDAPMATYHEWGDAFWAVGERVKKGKILLFFDELSWMSQNAKTFLAQLKSFWDNHLSKNPQLIFIACSSASSWLEKNLLSSTGFVGRISLTLTLQELSLADCQQFWPKYISIYEKLKVLAVTGGVPRYLEEVNPKRSAEDNIKVLCFTHGSLLVNEFSQIFSGLFLRDSLFYEKIVTLLAEGAKEQTQLQQLINKTAPSKQQGRLAEYLWELEEAGFIRRDYSWNIATGADNKLSQYRLKDNYLRFYLKYIKKNLNKIKRGIFQFKSLVALPQWHSIMGFQFENLILNNRFLIHEALQIDVNEIVNANPFFQHKTSRQKGCQVDYMIQTSFNSLYVCEIKFCKDKIKSTIIDEMETKLAQLKVPRGFSCRPVLIHVNGVVDEVIESDFFADVIDITALL